MSYNRAYNPDSQSNMSGITANYVRTVVNGILDLSTMLLTGVPPSVTGPDISVDWTTMSIADASGNKIDDLQIMSNKTDVANPADYVFLDGNTVLKMKGGQHAQTASGLPSTLAGYDGDLTVVYHGLSMQTNSDMMTITTIDSQVDISSYYRSGWLMSIHNGNPQVTIGRGSTADDISVSTSLPDPRPYADAIHTFSFVYKANDGTGTSSLKLYWDGVQIASTTKAHSPINWSHANNLYMGRFYNHPIYAMTYNAGCKIFKKALTDEEMLDQHTSQPTVIEKLVWNHWQDILVQFTFENISADGYIVRIHSVFPFNRESRNWKLGFRNQVTNQSTNTVHIDNTRIVTGEPLFDPYDLPYDLPFTRAKYPEFFPNDIHVHRFYVNLVFDGTNNVSTATGGFVSPQIPAVV